MPKKSPRERMERAFHVSFMLPEQAAELLDAYRDQVLTEAAELLTTKSRGRLDEIDEDDLDPSDWERHHEWCDAADLLLGARTAQPTQES